MSAASDRPSCPPTETDPTLAAVKTWLARAVVGLNLCPFARAPMVQGRIRFAVSQATDAEALLVDLEKELTLLRDADRQEVETTLLIHPHVLTDFYAYNDFLGIADMAVEMLGLEGEIQVASFHPDYRFENTRRDAIENYTNRSPFPILHLLREASIDEAVESVPDTDAIYERNIATLQKLGLEGWQALWKDGPSNGRAPDEGTSSD